MYTGVKTMRAIIHERASEEPDRKLVRFEDRSVTYGELDKEGNRFANALAGLGLKKGDKAAIMLANSPEFLFAWTGMAKLGVIEVPINTAYKGDLLFYLLNKADCKVLVIDEKWLDRIIAIENSLESVRHVIVVGTASAKLRNAETVLFTEFVQGVSYETPHMEVIPYDISAIMYTSGTTGPSKGVVITENADFRHARNVMELMAYGSEDRIFSTFPFFHLNTRNLVLVAMLADAELVIHKAFSVSNFWDMCRKNKVTAFNYMGAVLMMLFKQEERPDDADNPVRRAYGAPAPISIYEDFQKRFGVQLVEVYGSTELGTATMNTVDSFRIGSCGRAVPYFEVEIHDGEDNRLPPGVEGEIVVRPKEPYVLFNEYYKMAEDTLRAFRNLWFHTGDRGKTDEDGYFYFVDRMKDAIRRRGENISSWEVEKVITSFEEVLEAAVIGVPSALTEEEVMVVVVENEKCKIAPREILDRCQERLPYFAVPRYVRYTDQLPKTPTGRIKKFLLREQGITADTWDREEHGYVIKR